MNFNEYFRPNRYDNSLFFGGGSKSTTSSASSTSNQVTDQRVAGSEGSVVAGSGASISIESLDAQLADSVVREVGDISSDAIAAVSASSEFVSRAASDSAYSSALSSQAASQVANNALYSQEQTAKAAIEGNTNVSRDALNFGTNISERAIQAGSQLAKDALDFRSDESIAALDFAKQSQQSTNDLIRYTNEQFTSKLANNAGDAPQETVKDIVKWGAVAAAGLGLLYFFNRKGA